VQGELVGSRHKPYLLQRSATLGRSGRDRLVHEFGDRLALVSFSEEGGHIRTGQYAQCDRVGRCELQRRNVHAIARSLCLLRRPTNLAHHFSVQCATQEADPVAFAQDVPSLLQECRFGHQLQVGTMSGRGLA